MPDDQIPTPGDVLHAVDDVLQALVDQRPDDDFYEAAERFRDVFRRRLAARGFGDWDELRQLVALEAELSKAGEDERRAAVKTVRDWITTGRHEQASWN